MTARHLLSLGVAAGALSFSAPAFSQAGYPPEPTFEYAEPAPPPVVFESDPVVQPVPAPVAAPHLPRETEYDYDEEYEYDPPPPPHPVRAHPMPHVRHHAAPHPAATPHVMMHPGAGVAYPGASMAHGYPGAPYPYPPQHAGYAPPSFDREAWLDDCRMRIRGTDRRERGGIIGGLLGAIGGGVAGNRIADGERLAGTLIGAGVGGLAGLAIGAAIGAAADRDRIDECELYLDRYLTQYRPGPGYAYGYGYPAYTYTYVPVIVPVPQRAVVREYVTTEWVDVPAAPARTVTRTKINRQPAATKIVPAKRSKAAKGK